MTPKTTQSTETQSTEDMYDLTPYPITPIGNFLGFVLALLPLFSQIRKLSIAIWGYAIWVALGDFTTFVNTIIWHNNENIVAPVWCDIVTKLQIGSSIGIRTCALVLCIRLYKITRLQPSSLEITNGQRYFTLAYELFLIIVLPVLIMALAIIIQPVRFEILEEEGCAYVEYSYIGYIIYYAPGFIASLASAFLAPWTLRTFLRHRKEMNEFLTSNGDITTNKYKRLMAITLLDTIFNLPVLVIILVTAIAAGSESPLNDPYISWANVHDGAGGRLPGASLSTIIPSPASQWSTSGWAVFDLKWDEWLYVLHAIIFFAVFGTTPEMRRHYRAALCFLPERSGCNASRNRQRVSQARTISELAFESNPGHLTENLSALTWSRDPLSSNESTTGSVSIPSGVMIKSKVGYSRATSQNSVVGVSLSRKSTEEVLNL